MIEGRDCLSCMYFETPPDQKPCSTCLERRLNTNCYRPKTMRRLVIFAAASVLIMVLLITLAP